MAQATPRKAEPGMSACLQEPGYMPPVPLSVVQAGLPHSGRYAGRIDTIDWSDLRGPFQRPRWWRAFHHKRWQYVGIGSPDVFIGMAIVDLGWCMSAFVYVFDRVRQRVIADWSQEGAPWLSGQVSDQPVQGAQARFQGWGAKLSITHEEGDLMAVRVDAAGLRVHADLALGCAAPFLLAVGPVDGGCAHATQKSSALPVRGWVEVDGQRWGLHEAVASLDSSNGLLSRDTAWRWACAHDHHVGFNLQQGYFGQAENALWLDGALIPLGAAHFAFDETQPLNDWHVSTECGLLDLYFKPEGARHADRNLLVAASYYIQPVGTFHGVVKVAKGAPPVEVDGLLGVTEDHRSRW
jgi:hypothetical protein